MRPEFKIKGVKSTTIKQIFCYFAPHIKPHQRTLITAFFCMLGLTAMELLRPWPIKLIFDAILIPQPKTVAALEKISPWLTNTDSLLMLIGISILTIAVLMGLFGFGQAYLTSSVGQRVVAAVRHQLYSHIQRLSHSFHDESSLGDLLARLTGDIRMMRELLVTSVIFVSERTLALIGMIGIMLWIDWKLTLIALIVLPILALTGMRFNKKIKKAGRKQRRKESRITGTMTERLSAVTLVQAYARESYEENRFARQNNKSMNAGLVSTRLEAHLNRMVQVILAIGTASVLWFGVKQVQAGMITPGDLLVFIAYLSSLYKPVRKLASLTGRLAKATVCGERIIAILDIDPEIKDAPGAIPAPVFKGEISFNQLNFGYKPKQLVLKNASWLIRPGETVVLVGQSGAGKSTIARLMLRFYDPVEGIIKIDGTDIRHYKLESVRSQIAVVLQDPYLFGASIRDNIGYGKLDASEQEIIEAAKAANAHDFIEALAEGYDTVISERGSSLSGGQQQRIAIARAIIRQSPIVILDEPTSKLDNENRSQVDQALSRLTEHKTCVLITHDRQTAMSANRIFTLAKGELTEIDREEADRVLNSNIANKNLETIHSSLVKQVGY